MDWEPRTRGQRRTQSDGREATRRVLRTDAPRTRQGKKTRLPSEALRDFLFSPRGRDVRFDRPNSRFWYRTGEDEWRRAYGLTYMLAHAFWPDYDRNDPVIQAGVDMLKRQHRAKQRQVQRLKRQANGEPRRKRRRTKAMRSGSKTTAEVEALAAGQPRDRLYGMPLGELVHRQLHVWASDRYRGTRFFGRAESVEWCVFFCRGRGAACRLTPHRRPPHRWTQAIRRKLAQLGVDVRYGEYLLYDARVPLGTQTTPPGLRSVMTLGITGTSIDLVGWSRAKRAVVLIEVKTGSKWNMEMGNGPMKGKAASVLRLNNSPLNQAIVQLSVTHAVVEGFYDVQKAEGLLVWANDRVGVEARWLTDRLKTAGRVLVAELHRHLEARGGKAWAEPKA